jgi:hypothetical protein
MDGDSRPGRPGGWLVQYNVQIEDFWFWIYLSPRLLDLLCQEDQEDEDASLPLVLHIASFLDWHTNHPW